MQPRAKEIFLDALDGKATTLWVSPQIQEILGFPPEEWVADPDLWMRQMHHDDRARVAEATERGEFKAYEESDQI